jgi:hypothetical protein
LGWANKQVSGIPKNFYTGLGKSQHKRVPVIEENNMSLETKLL